MPKYSPGDLVWARRENKRIDAFPHIPEGEYAAVIKCYCGVATFGPWYELEADIIAGAVKVTVGEHNLRPRRDDYQQHEGLSHASLHDLINISNLILREDIKMWEPA